ncbi:MAG: PQQ-dependent sugar dehydrogenase [Planctomycetota bacterium]
MRLNGRKLRHETLEPRNLLAGDTYLINFQGDEATTPTRYLEDLGDLFADRGGGLAYGWSSDHIDQARERSLLDDQRHDTLIHFELGQSWEFALPAGRYEVTVAVGDPANNDGLHTINIEGMSLFDAVPDTEGVLMATMEVDVTDGRLTIDQGTAANKATRINYTHIVGVSGGANAAPSTPIITEPAVDGQVVNPSDVHMEAVGYFDAEGDAHKSTDWEVWTAGGGGELVWQTLGIQGVERLHTHLGDGIFAGALAGRSELDGNTDYELRTRYRDDTGSVSGYATRLFTTGAASTIFPMELQDIAATPAPAWTTTAGFAIDLPASAAILAPGDQVLAVDLDGGGQSSYPPNESPAFAVDGTLAKYLNFGESNAGFIVTPAGGPSLVSGFQITTANDAEERDPRSWALYGTGDEVLSADNSDGSAEDWVLIGAGSIDLPLERGADGPVVAVDNASFHRSYRLVFTGVRNARAANAVQVAEVQFFGESSGNAATGATLKVDSPSGGATLLEIAASAAAGNTVIDGAALGDHESIRVVIEAGPQSLSLPASNLALTGDGQARTIFLPAVELIAGQRLILWVDSAGSSYVGDATQTEPDFTTLAREATLTAPFIAAAPGFVIEEVGSDYRLPVNIAFVPDAGPNPDDPLYFVNELYGSIQVVTRDGTKHEFATGLLDYNPEGPISGSGEQGLTGLAVARDAADPEVYHLYVGMLWDNGAPPGGGAHYPKVERLTSTAGGLSIDTRSVLLNMQPETQGQSHQVSNISIGPDGMLYVQNGDGFDASTALDLDQYRGKVLRMTLDGAPATGNPYYDASDGLSARDYVYADGFRNAFGGDWRGADDKLYVVENGPSVDRFAQVNPGVSYGWDGSNASMRTNAIYNWEPSHAPVNIAFVQPEAFRGSGFPAHLQDVALVSESGPTYAAGPQELGKRITYFDLDAGGQFGGDGPESLVDYVGSGRGSVVALAAGPDGVYFSEFYEDTGDNGPTASGSRIFRLRYENPTEGDYDIDGDVDADDYLVWRQTFGSNLLLSADGNGNGVVDAADYTVWRGAFAAASSGEAPAAVVGRATADQSVAKPAAGSEPARQALPSLTNHVIGSDGISGGFVTTAVPSGWLTPAGQTIPRADAGASEPAGAPARRLDADATRHREVSLLQPADQGAKDRRLDAFDEALAELAGELMHETTNRVTGEKLGEVFSAALTIGWES